MNDKITLGDKSFKKFISYETISKAIDDVAEKINNDNRGCTDIPVILCVLNGSILFTGELLKRLDFPCEIVSLKMTSYYGTQSTGTVRAVMGITGSIEGRRVIIVEDIVDTGGTIRSLLSITKEHKATETKICTLFLKPDVFKNQTHLDYVGMEVPNKFIVGFGLDYNEIGRNYKDLYILDE